MTPRELARVLFDTGAVEVRSDPREWFTWASGKRAPVYCDNRMLISDPRGRVRVVEALVASLGKRFPEAEVIAGTATAGIPWAAWLAERLELPMVYVRSSAKEHGKRRRVEGRPLRGERVVVIEDLISFGGSSLEAVRGIEAEGGKVIGVQAIVTYGFPETARRFEQAGVRWSALVDFDDLIAVLDPDPETARLLREWRSH